MHIIIKHVLITDKNSPHNQSIQDIRIQNGMITEISNSIESTDDIEIFDATNKQISVGWFDLLASMNDPGLEYKEDLISGSNAAMQGGFTQVCCMPSTIPALHSKSEIEYVINKNKNHLVQVFPLGAITRNCEGKELTEMYDMQHAGAVAFADAPHAIYDAGILLRSLQYVKPFFGTIINIPNNYKIVGNASINEGVMSMQLGMYGIPAVLEEIMVIRDIKLAEYADGKIHIGCISTKESVAQIKIAKQNGIQVSASVTPYHLYFDESVLYDYDAQFKVNPPLRTKEDTKALIQAVADGTIDTICSFHQPHETDSKDVEFEHASFGMETLEATFGAAYYALQNEISIDEFIETITTNPRKNLNIESPIIRVGKKANLTIFDANESWILEKKMIQSKSKNCPFIGKPLKGKPIAVINNNQFKIL